MDKSKLAEIDLSGKVFGGEFQFTRKIGKGSFGEVYLGTNIQTGEEVAIKVESSNVHNQRLHLEAYVYYILMGELGIGRLRKMGNAFNFNILVIDLLGPSLEYLFNSCGRRFTIKTILMLADQMIARLISLHQKSFIHRDLKPENFLMGHGDLCHKLFLIDFGLANKIRDKNTGHHIPYRGKKDHTGNARFCSINANLGTEQSRRDDLESLGYIMVYFYKGTLPWYSTAGKTKQQLHEMVYEIKISTPIEVLCKSMPAEFSKYLKYCRTLPFEAQPDYLYLRRLIRNLFKTIYNECDYIYDWNMPKKVTQQNFPLKKMEEPNNEEKENKKPRTNAANKLSS